MLWGGAIVAQTKSMSRMLMSDGIMAIAIRLTPTILQIEHTLDVRKFSGNSG